MNRLARILAALPLAAAAATAAPSPSSADPIADFYRGKTIRVVIGFGVGGGYDLYGRLAALYLGRFVPGNPQVVAQNMPGAGGLRASEYVYSAAPKDGTVLAAPNMHLALQGILDPRRGAKIDVSRINWIGRWATSIDVGISWHTSNIRSVEDIKKRRVVVASSGKTSSASIVPWALNKLAGTKFKVVMGYRGSRSFSMAMLQGEADAQSAIGWTTLKSRRADWLRDRKIHILWQLSPTRSPELPDVPAFPEFASNETDRRVLTLLTSSGRIGRTLFAAPEVPPERVAALRQAFWRLVNDPRFVADAKKRNIDLDPAPGDRVARIVNEAVSAPKAVIERARWAVTPEESSMGRRKKK